MEPSIVPTMVWGMLIVVQVAKQTTKVPQLTFPQEKQLREQKQEIKREHDTRFPEGEEHMYFDGDVYEDQMKTTGNPLHFQYLQQHLQQQQQQTQKGLQITRLQTEIMEIKPFSCRVQAIKTTCTNQ